MSVGHDQPVVSPPETGENASLAGHVRGVGRGFAWRSRSPAAGLLSCARPAHRSTPRRKTAGARRPRVRPPAVATVRLLHEALGLVVELLGAGRCIRADFFEELLDVRRALVRHGVAAALLPGVDREGASRRHEPMTRVREREKIGNCSARSLRDGADHSGAKYRSAVGSMHLKSGSGAQQSHTSQFAHVTFESTHVVGLWHVSFSHVWSPPAHVASSPSQVPSCVVDAGLLVRLAEKRATSASSTTTGSARRVDSNSASTTISARVVGRNQTFTCASSIKWRVSFIRIR